VRDIEETDGWYVREGGLCGSCNGKPGSRCRRDLVRERRPTRREATGFFFSGAGVPSCGGFSAVSASLSRSTMAASACCCFLTSGALRVPPRVAAALSADERNDVVSDTTDFLCRNYRLSMEETKENTCKTQKEEIRTACSWALPLRWSAGASSSRAGCDCVRGCRRR